MQNNFERTRWPKKLSFNQQNIDQEFMLAPTTIPCRI